MTEYPSHRPQLSKGFSLIELLVALAILSISILTMVGLVPVVMGTHQVSR
ncbi:MAG: prepilin-type N-terminal cleavage/methylation domain-containing protein, partial [Verrucomicrobiota bacterium]